MHSSPFSHHPKSLFKINILDFGFLLLPALLFYPFQTIKWYLNRWYILKSTCTFAKSKYSVSMYNLYLLSRNKSIEFCKFSDMGNLEKNLQFSTHKCHYFRKIITNFLKIFCTVFMIISGLLESCYFCTLCILVICSITMDRMKCGWMLDTKSLWSVSKFLKTMTFSALWNYVKECDMMLTGHVTYCVGGCP